MKNVHIDLAETRDRNEIGIIYVPLHTTVVENWSSSCTQSYERKNKKRRKELESLKNMTLPKDMVLLSCVAWKSRRMGALGLPLPRIQSGNPFNSPPSCNWNTSHINFSKTKTKERTT